MKTLGRSFLSRIPPKLVKVIEHRLNRRKFRRALRNSGREKATDYWSRWMVLTDPQWKSQAESIGSFHARVSQYPGYLDLMPVEGYDDLCILDYGCGPGHDLAGFAEYSSARRIVGVDVSQRAVDSARERLSLHERQVEIFHIPEHRPLQSFETGTFDYVHSSGVLHHVADPKEALQEIRRVLDERGRVRIMVYNQESIWYHLYAGFVIPEMWRAVPSETATDDVFRMSTDGPSCPIAFASTTTSFAALANEAGFDCHYVGAAVSRHELEIVDQYMERALSSSRLGEPHRSFLEGVSMINGVPTFQGRVAGIDLVLELTPI